VFPTVARKLELLSLVTPATSLAPGQFHSPRAPSRLTYGGAHDTLSLRRVFLPSLVSLSSFILARDPDDGRPPTTSSRPSPSGGELEARWRAPTNSSMVDLVASGERRRTMAASLRGSPGGMTVLPGEFHRPDPGGLGGTAVSPQDSRRRVEPNSPAGKPEPFFSFSFFLIIFQKNFLLFSTNLFLQNFLLNFFHNLCSDFFFFPQIFINFCCSFFLFRKLFPFFYSKLLCIIFCLSLSDFFTKFFS
jgi:hypothetical protein